MTPTPRTGDALESILREKGELSEDTAPAVLVKLCRQLERENAAMREAIREAHRFAHDILKNYECGHMIDSNAEQLLTRLQPFTVNVSQPSEEHTKA
jgi:hypothetical protein